jgi:hypothetical protein
MLKTGRYLALPVVLTLLLVGCSNTLSDDECRYLSERDLVYEWSLAEVLVEQYTEELSISSSQFDENKRALIREQKPIIAQGKRDEYKACLREGKKRYSDTDLSRLSRYGP